MEKVITTTRASTCIFFLISSYAFLSLFEKTTAYSSSYYASVVLALLLAILVVFAVRTSILAWITVMVLLAFVGKRRRVLAKEGRKITSEMAMYFAHVVVKERGVMTFACAAIFSIVTMAWL